MPVGHHTPRNYYSVGKDTGKITRKDRSTGELHEFDYIEGFLKEIKYRSDSDYGDKFQFIFTDRTGQAEDIFQAGSEASYIHAIIGSLSNNEPPEGMIRFSPYLKTVNDKEYINMVAYDQTKGKDGMMRFAENFPDSLPEIQKVKNGNKIIYMKGERVEFIRKLAEQTSAKYYAKWVELTAGAGPSKPAESQIQAEDGQILDTEGDDLPF